MSPVSEMWQPGQVVDGRYEVREVVQSGGMGVVYRVWHRDWHTELAVKTPRPELLDSPGQVANFETEAQTWVELGLHPHTVACVYVRRLGGLPRVFAEWIDGGSLADAIRDRRLYEGGADAALARLLDVAIQFAWGLEHAHASGLVHQDVKPANALLTTAGAVKVTDFGLARARAVVGEPVAVAGASVLAGFGGLTPAYCSPEQAAAACGDRRSAVLTKATDVWSWAVSVLEMFLGRPPCERGQIAAEVLEAYLADEIRPEAGLSVPAMPVGVVDLLRRCLAPAPADRPRMRELANELIEEYANQAGRPFPRARPEPAELRADGLNNTALSMLDLGRVEQAEQAWQAALATDSRHLSTIYNRGLHLWRTGKQTDEQVVDALEKARAGDPARGPGDYLLGLVHLERGDIDAATSFLRRAARGAPYDHEVAAELARAESIASPGAPRVLEGHQPNVTSVAFNPSGLLVATGTTSGEVRIWDVSDGRCLDEFDASGGYNASTKVSFSVDGRAQCWSIGNHSAVYRWAVPESPDQVTLREGSDLRGLSSLFAEHAWMHTVALAPEGHIGLSGYESGAVVVWDITERRPRHILTGHTGPVVAVRAHGDLGLSGSADGTARLWSTTDGRCLRILGSPDSRSGVRGVALSTDEMWGATGHSDGTVRVWDLTNGRCVHTLTGHRSWVGSVVFTRDARTLVSGGGDATVRIWALESGRCRHTFTGHTHVVGAAAIDPGSHRIVSGAGAEVQLWDVPAPGPKAPWYYGRPRGAEALDAGAARVASARQRVEQHLDAREWTSAAEELRTARQEPGYEHDPRLFELWRRVGRHGRRRHLTTMWQLPETTLRGEDVALSNDGRLALISDRDGALHLWDLDSSGRLLWTSSGHTDVISVVLTADGRSAVSVGVDYDRTWSPDRVVRKTIRVWDIRTGAQRHELHVGRDDHVAVSPDGSSAVSMSKHTMPGSPALDVIISRGYTGAITLASEAVVWDLKQGLAIHNLTWSATVHGSWNLPALGLAMGSDACFALTDPVDGTGGVQVWDGKKRRLLQTIPDEGRGRFVFSPDGRSLLSHASGAISVWDVVSGRLLRTLDHTDEVRSVAVSPDSRFVLSGDKAGMVRVWDIGEGRCLHTQTAQTRPVISLAFSGDVAASTEIPVDYSSPRIIRLWELDWDYAFTEASADGQAKRSWLGWFRRGR